MICDPYKEALPRQLALDFCVTPEQVLDKENHFSVYEPREGRRRFRDSRETLLKIASVRGKLLFTGREDIVCRMRELYESTPGDWFFEYRALRELEERLRPFGVRPDLVHPFYLPDRSALVPARQIETRLYEGAELERFRGDPAFDEAFAFDPDAPDLFGIGALKDGQILGMAGASADSPLLWQIGVNVSPGARQAGLASYLVSRAREEVFSRGAVPFYGTAVSHLLSQRVAARAGFLPAWAEMNTVESLPSSP